MVKKNLNQQIIINKTLEMVEEQECAFNLNLRKIAKELHCAHTNIYNYFTSYDDLLWKATAEAIKRMSKAMFSEEGVEGFVRKYITFAFEHKGYYKLIWYERFNTEIPDELKEQLGYPSRRASEIYSSEMGKEISEVIETMHIAFAYVHGMLAMYLNNRIEYDQVSIDEQKEQIVQNALDILLNDEKRTGGKR